jgi:general secretion pathway protein M
MKDKISAFLNQLSERDRAMLGLGSLFCFFYLYYLILYSPLEKAVHNARQQLTEMQATKLWMEQARSGYKAQTKTIEISSNQLLTLLAGLLKNASFKSYSYQLQQTGSHDIQLTFDEVPFNDFMRFTRDLNEKYAFIVKQWLIERTSTPGVVKLSITIAVV